MKRPFHKLLYMNAVHEGFHGYKTKQHSKLKGQIWRLEKPRLSSTRNGVSLRRGRAKDTNSSQKLTEDLPSSALKIPNYISSNREPRRDSRATVSNFSPESPLIISFIPRAEIVSSIILHVGITHLQQKENSYR